MDRIMKTNPATFLKIVPYRSEIFTDLNSARPCYGDRRVDVISIIPVGIDKDGNPLFCYELKFD